MKLDCKEISISDDEFGCTIEFKQEKEDEFNIEKSKLMNCICESFKTFVYFYNHLRINFLKKYTQVD